ncbi:SRPBCC family protein [Mycolicibacterium tokaiense]|uniref:Polyketide cyclase / dehydrase and lipid transport n=1 Tax=Mycolicibacterium tokaiense TaxID=39695 RepID=A0A378TGK3_9MYCO|nr:SRPBCC family protein [Mycolicibacterium tokaiense]BBY85717.1 hypothetical protein MTOK_14990 [Mycolicibacterium tokaiense]STZ59770.1 Polyketide cyclase / dehydrase and lipid transport [Mycolicibacterium tokaiense]
MDRCRHGVLIVVIGFAAAWAVVDGPRDPDAAYRYLSTESPLPEPLLACDGQTVDPNAAIRYRTQAVIPAPLQTIWDLQVDVARWPSWQPAVADATVLTEGPLRPQSQFLWTTPVPATEVTPATTLYVTSTVQQLEELACIRWSGPARGEGVDIDRGVHVWTFTEIEGGVLVSTEETWTGRQVDATPELSTTHLGLGLQAWLEDLRAAAVDP